MSKTATYDVVKNGTPFQNPTNGDVAAASSGAASATGKVVADIAAVDAALVITPGDPVLLAQRAELVNLQDRFTVLNGGPANPGLPAQYTIGGAALSFAAITQHTNYFSGAGTTPPLGLTTGGVSFVNVLGAATAMKSVAKELGETPSDDPCKTVNDLLGSVLGKMAEILGPLLNVLNAFVNTVMAVANMIALLDNFVNNIWQIMNDEVNRLKQYLEDLAAWGISSFLNSIIKDPCLAAVLGAIATPALQQAIATAPVVPS